MMTVQFALSMTLAGGATSLIQITIPQGLTAVGINPGTCQILNSGSTAAGVISASGTLINIGPISGGAWAAGAISMSGNVAIRIIS
jgi:hypothetical protein